MPRKKSDNMTRFTAWISKEERRRLKEKADRMGTSENLILRFAIRRYFNMEIPEEAESDARGTGVIPVAQKANGQP